MLEVLVAFVIASAALGLLAQAGLAGIGTSRTASKYEQAVSRARSRLAIAVHSDPLQPGEWNGDEGGFTWSLVVTPVDSTAIRPVNTLTMRGSSEFPLTLYAVSVRVTWRGGLRGREVRLDTRQIGQGMR